PRNARERGAEYRGKCVSNSWGLAERRSPSRWTKQKAFVFPAVFRAGSCRVFRGNCRRGIPREKQKLFALSIAMGSVARRAPKNLKRIYRGIPRRVPAHSAA